MTNIHLIKRYETELKAKIKILDEEVKSDEKIQKMHMYRAAIFLIILCGFFLTIYRNELGLIISGTLFLLVVFGILSDNPLGGSYKAHPIITEIKNLKSKIKEIKLKKETEEKENERITSEKSRAKIREMARDYDSAIEIWEKLGEIRESARVRKLRAEQGAVKVTQKVVHGDEVTKTEIKDSVLNRSNIGGGGKSRAEEIKEIKELLDSGAIDDDEFKQMKKEILGK